MSQYLFLFTIGPVQSFISQARKTQDLYAGSFLLSRLCRFAAKKYREDCDGKIIFPNNIDAESLPNRFIGKIEADKDKLKGIGETVEKEVRDKFRDIVFKSLEKYDKVIFSRQVDHFLTIFWTFQLLKDYRKDYGTIERNLGSIKNIRAFKQTIETGRKCSLCGERNVLFYRKREKEKWIKDNRPSNKLLPKFLDSNSEIYDYERKDLNKIIAPGEGLCSLCFTKRNLSKCHLSNFDDHFPSTSEIALYHTLQQLPKNYQNIKFDAQGILALKDGKQLNETEFEHIKDTQRVYEQLKKQSKDKKINFSDYYALLTFDGDHMGQWLSGEFLKDKSRLREFQEALSERLTDFGRWAKNYIEGKGKDTIKKGCSVYAGGDDFMGFICLDYLLETLKNLREKFKILVNDAIQKEFNTNKELTFSAGIAIAHYKTPLSKVLQWTRSMEHEAKEKGDRDAFSIAILKHSGDIRKTRFKWQYGSSSTVDTLIFLVKSLQKDFSDTFIRSLGVEFMKLMDEDGKYGNKPLVRLEMRRLLKRSYNNPAKGEKIIDSLTDKLNLLYTYSNSLNNFISALLVVEFIEREVAV